MGFSVWRRTATVAAFAAAALTASAFGAPAMAGTGGGESLDLGAAFATPIGGKAAEAALGDRLDQVAKINALTRTKLRDLLSDKAMRIDRTGHVLAIDPKPTIPPAPGASTRSERGPYPYEQTFQLHSKPGSSKVIYLDFDGEVISGTAWNTNYGVSTNYQPGFSLDSDPSFNNAEMDAVQGIFQRVAEDYAPFDVDVTTQDPGVAAIDRSGSGDPYFGTRALVTASWELSGNICSDSCGGVAYIGVYDLTSSHQYYQPALVFPHMLSNGEKYIAEAVTHEVGHNLGLYHDGLTDGTAYYQGHAMWAPVMGVGYYRPVVQWSAGEYSGANNTEDDLVVIQANGLSYRSDDHGDSPASATALSGTFPVTGSGIVSTRSDVDVFAVTTTCSATLSAAVNPGPRSPNLDARVRILDASGGTLASADPPATMVDYDVAGGLGATASTTLPAGTYYVEVDGVGYGTASTGYTDYASLGQYTVQVNGCTGPTTTTYKQVSAGLGHTCAVTTGGAVKCWGDNAYGQLGNGTTTDSVAPVAVSGLSSGVTVVWTGANHACANQVGAIKCWGLNANGQLGDTTTVNRTTPVQVLGLTSGVRALTAGDAFSCAVNAARAVRCWGLTYGAQPKTVSGVSGAVQVTAGAGHACAVTTVRAAKCWGNNAAGQLGDGTRTNRTKAVQVKTMASGIAGIWAGKNHTCAHASQGWAKCWGANANGQLGDGTRTTRLTPVMVSGMSTGIVGMRGGLAFTCAVNVSRQPYCWGRNLQGQLGTGSTVGDATVPQPVANFGSNSAGMLAAGTAHACVLDQVSSRAYCWGANDQGQVGDGTLVQRRTPTLVVE
ncbi:MAG: zinc-dependent metalloprotease family protein [Tetrasphaera sp.]